MTAAKVIQSAVAVGIVLTLILSHAGCSSAEFGETINLADGKHHTLDRGISADQPLSLPAELPFNVVDSQRHSEGTCAADSTASADGRALCKAAGGNGGNGWAEFQLGAVLSNDTGGNLDVTVKFDVGYRFTSSATTPDKPTLAAYALKVFIQDSSDHMLRKQLLVEADSRQGPQEWSGKESPSFDVTLEANKAYHFILAARTDVTTDEATEASAKINVDSLTITIHPKTN